MTGLLTLTKKSDYWLNASPSYLATRKNRAGGQAPNDAKSVINYLQRKKAQIQDASGRLTPGLMAQKPS
jgi:hypothetical protein